MSFLELSKKRFSLRNYSDKKVEEEKLQYILESARYAPSACNLQPVNFIVITDKNSLSEICATYSGDWLKRAPAIIVAIGDHSRSWKRRDGKDHCDIDVAIAVDHLTLAACDAGLGTCWICAFDSKRCQDALSLPDNMEVIALIPVGYPLSEGSVMKKRREPEEMIKRM